jgi:hypothetical protein
MSPTLSIPKLSRITCFFAELVYVLNGSLIEYYFVGPCAIHARVGLSIFMVLNHFHPLEIFHKAKPKYCFLLIMILEVRYL